MTLTLPRCKEIQRQLENIDRELDGIIQEFYMPAGAQNTEGNIRFLSRTHAKLVELLADRVRELEEENKKNNKS